MQKQTEKKKERTKEMNLENLINLDDKLTEAYIMLENAATLNETIFKEFDRMEEHATEPFELMTLKQTSGIKKLNDIEHDYLINLNKALDELNNLLRAEIEQQRAIELPQDNNRL